MGRRERNGDCVKELGVGVKYVGVGVQHEGKGHGGGVGVVMGVEDVALACDGRGEVAWAR